MSQLVTVTYNNNTIIDNVEFSNDSISIKYCGNVIATLGDNTKTLKCSNKLMKGNIILDGGTIKTLKCAGKIMSSDVTLVSESAGPLFIDLDYFVLPEKATSLEIIEDL